MQISTGRAKAGRFLGVYFALWLGCGPAWAGHGGPDLGSLQGILDDFCSAVGMTRCPQLPTLTQAVLELSALENIPPELARFEGSSSPTAAVNAVNPPVASFSLSSLPDVTPLAFISSPTGATITQRGDPQANSFFYGATNGPRSTTLNLVYDYLPLTNSNFTKGELVAQISIPLVVLNSDHTETEAPTNIQITGATGCGKTVPCVSATATGTFGGKSQTVAASSLGLTVSVVFQPSPNSATPHAIFLIQGGLLVTQSTDPVYFNTDPASPFLNSAFVNEQLGVTPKSVGSPVGIAPFAAPQCPGESCGQTPQASNFPFCASIMGNRAVGAFYSIATTGTTYLSAPISSQVTCPF
jgi:hypothetical protein